MEGHLTVHMGILYKWGPYFLGKDLGKGEHEVGDVVLLKSGECPVKVLEVEIWKDKLDGLSLHFPVII